MTQPCPCCEAEIASVIVSSPDGKVLVGRKCAALLERLAILRGVETERRPLLRRVK